MPAIPTPIIVAVANLPWSNTANTVALDGTNSIPSTGNTITGYQWTIFEQPEGVIGTWPTDPNAAYLTNANTATPTLNNVLLPGSYGIILVVTDDNPDPKLDSSYTSHVPTQLTAAQDGLYGLDQGRFAGPIPSQIVWVRKEEQYSGLIKPGRGDRGWFNVTGGHWDLIDKVEDISQYMAEEESGIRHYDEIQELTPGHGVIVEDVKFEDGEVTLPDGQMITTDVGGVSITLDGGSGTISLSATQISTGGDFYCGGSIHVDTINEYIPDQGVTIDGLRIKDGGLRVATETDRIYTNELYAGSLTGSSTTLLIATTSATFSGEVHVPDELMADLISAESNNSSVTLRGTGAHNSDISVDAIQADSNDSGVVVMGKGTHTYDLQADVINSNTITGTTTLDLTAPAGDLTLLMDAIGSVLSLQAPDGSITALAKDMWLSSDTTDLLLTANTTFVVARGGTGVADLRTDIVESDTDNDGVTIIGRGTHTADLLTDIITPSSNDSSITLLGSGTHTADIRVDVIEPSTDNTAVTILGRGTHTADLFTDIIQPSTNSTSVTVRGKGTHTSDLSVDIIQADSNNSYVEILGKGTHTYDLVAAAIKADGVAGGSSGLMLTSGGTLTDVTVEGMDEVILDARGGLGSGLGVITAIGKLRAQGGTSSSRYRVPVGLASSAPGTASNGSLNQVVYTFTLPANSLIVAGDTIKGKVTSSCVSNKGVKMRVKFGGTIICERTASSGTTSMMIDFSVVAKSSSTQTATAYALETNAGGMYAHTALSVNCANSTTITVEFDTGVASDETLETVSLELWCV